MVKLLIISDDFTGALDTGVQFVKKNIKTKVVTDFSERILRENEAYTILVIDADTRKMSGEEAYLKVKDIADTAVKAGVKYLFKKTDSALRGNVGSELQAVLDAAGTYVLSFAPAFPKMERVTRNGIQYLGKLPVHLSAFGKDPYEPVLQSKVKDIIKEQYRGNVKEACRIEFFVKDTDVTEKTIVVYDAETDEEMELIARKIFEQKTAVMAGCAGLANAVSKVLAMNYYMETSEERRVPLFVVCGSVCPITKRQLDYGEKRGFLRIRLNAGQRNTPNFLETDEGKKFLDDIWRCVQSEKPVLLDTTDIEERKGQCLSEQEKRMARNHITDNLGCITKALLKKGMMRTILVIGGDTLKKSSGKA